jgi:DNA-binding NarL/FixJ family response regulator
MSAGQLWREHLTPSQAEVAELVHRGMTNDQIAADLVKITQTIKFHVSESLMRLGFENRLQLALWWERVVLVPLPIGWEGSE